MSSYKTLTAAVQAALPQPVPMDAPPPSPGTILRVIKFYLDDSRVSDAEFKELVRRTLLLALD